MRNSLHLLIFLLFPVLALSLGAHRAHATPRGIQVRPPAALVRAQATVSSHLLFLNHCPNGCLLAPGFEDSSSNHSSIIDGPSMLSAWPHSDEDFQELKRCVSALYAPFDIIVTDQDPGSEPHYEAMVSGTGEELGFPQAGGVAPFDCAPIDNAITFTFAALFQDMRELCNVVGQESAHAFGLDHEMLCDDPLTYLQGCPDKSFQDQDAPCGEFTERPCDCGNATQNSYQHLLNVLGPSKVIEVEIVEPREGDSVAAGFSVRARVIGDALITSAELRIDGSQVSSLEGSPFDFTAPRTLAQGSHELEVRLYDERDQYAFATVTVSQRPCQASQECDFSFSCVGGRCVLGPGNPEGLGASCRNESDCQSELCERGTGDVGVCVATCEESPLSCPANFHCATGSGADKVCLPTPSGQSGFCLVGAGGTGSGAGAALLLLVAALLYSCRKRGES